MKYCFTALLFLSLLACGSEPDAAGLSGPGPAPAPAADELSTPYQNLTPEEFAAKMQDEDVVVLDVRTPAEVAAGKIEGAVELDFRDPAFATKVKALDPDATYLVYCAVGGRSSQACAQMQEAGFDRVYNLDGGYTAWKEQ
ncbi:rhodanese-like domain-containing protein [Lewinella sp. IMCC34183]|uniref:rhodanese-like domain-containing protein n=1 Tax=Lewinella sp. IMCC34183 TaxID=2248762 RepID=UPI000E267274|nr:rhodanese-like domain-containing protein [Lewinella sp. IMCC34183]